jgi:stearoyl-CoA desaturase (delta-9 desaturase)
MTDVIRAVCCINDNIFRPVRDRKVRRFFSGLPDVAGPSATDRFCWHHLIQHDSRALMTNTEAKPLNWPNVIFIASAHLFAAYGVYYLIAEQFNWWTVGLGIFWYLACGFSITGGYHRLFSHQAYRANWFVRLGYLLFGAASAQNSALKWSADHRVHHQNTDMEADPYNIKKGFWWAHISWIFYRDTPKDLDELVKDLQQDKLVMFQNKYYPAIALGMGLIIPGSLGFLWGDPVGTMLVAGFVRLVLQWHATFSINSFAHILGTQPYSTKNSARDSFITAILSFGEGYHNFHHRFQSDYRNGLRWWQFDPTKWVVWAMSKIGFTWKLNRVPDHAIERAKELVRQEAEGLSGVQPNPLAS